MKNEILTRTLTVECDAITATIVQNVEAKKGFVLEISNPKTDEVLATEYLPSMRHVYARLNTFNRSYRKEGLNQK